MTLFLGSFLATITLLVQPSWSAPTRTACTGDCQGVVDQLCYDYGDVYCGNSCLELLEDKYCATKIEEDQWCSDLGIVQLVTTGKDCDIAVTDVYGTSSCSEYNDDGKWISWYCYKSCGGNWCNSDMIKETTSSCTGVNWFDRFWDMYYDITKSVGSSYSTDDFLDSTTTSYVSTMSMSSTDICDSDSDGICIDDCSYSLALCESQCATCSESLCAASAIEGCGDCYDYTYCKCPTVIYYTGCDCDTCD